MRRPLFEMNERLFAEMERDNCWFEFAFGRDLPEIVPRENIFSLCDCTDDTLVQRHVFAMIFGSFGYSVNLHAAKMICREKILKADYKLSSDKSLNESEYRALWNTVAKYHVLYGTAFVYEGNYKRGAYLLLNGLKTRAIGLFMPYCDFINYVLSVVEQMPAEYLEIEGCGSSVDEPMGSTSLNGGVLMPEVAEMVICALERDAGGIIMAHRSNLKYGNITRLGSTGSDGFKNIIDVYEVLMLNYRGELKKIRLYFNGYFSTDENQKIRLPNGFHLDECSLAAECFKVVE